ncbi:hypothetical protein D9756_010748 [Leucocoprinus leucothites]|uniref:DUF6533 domain-containing protein n=1 Tax=Leucocoprinus leucothites TaxID=201217 RepID=A0A8H5CUI1_9AGAR|nr:hypothetical protein D9756_010748 [Leucoagaricus leucothites]
MLVRTQRSGQCETHIMSTDVLIRQYGNVASLSLIAYDCFITWDQEIQYVWRSSRWWIKLSFFTARYLALAAQIVNVVHSTPVVLEHMNGNCLAWFRAQVASILLLLGNMELIMMIRVCALYDKNRIIRLCLLSWFFVSRVINIWIFIVIPPNMRANIFCLCRHTVKESNQLGAVVFGAINVFGIQCFLWALTYQRYRYIVRPGLPDNPILRLVMRQNSWAFLVLSGALLSILPYSVSIRRVGLVISCTLTCTLSVLSCRLILNLRSFKNAVDESHDVVLSTIVDSIELESQHSTE